MKKFITIAASVAFLFTGVLSASAQSSAELEAKIAALLEQINALNGSTTVSTGATFVYQGGLLKVGSRGQQVRDLQTCLAALGNNPDSNIDEIFGNITASAVRSFQAQNGVSIDGIVGPVTGPLYTNACKGSTVVVSTDEDQDNDNDAPSKDRFDTTDGDEADFTDFDLEDADDDDIEEGEDKAEIAEIEFELEDEGAALLERMDIIVDYIGGDSADEDDAWEVFDTFYLMVDGDIIAEMDADDEDDWEDVTVGGDYAAAPVSATNPVIGYDTDENRFRISGINHVFEADEDHTIVIAADIANSIDLGSNEQSEWVFTVADNSLRFIDEAGITQYLTEESGVEGELVAFQIEEEGQEDELTVRESDDDPEATALQVEDDQKSDWYNIFTFEIDVDEDSQDLDFDELVLSLTTTTADVDDVISDLELRMDGDSFDDYDYAAAGTTTKVVTFDLDDEDFIIDADDKATVELWAEFKAANVTNYAEGATVTAEVTSANTDAWDVEGGDDLNATQLQGAAEGEVHTLLVDGAVVTLNSVSESVSSSGDGSSSNSDDVAKFTFDINVEAFDEPVYIPVVAAQAVTAVVTDASDDSSAAVTGTLTISSSATKVTGGDGNEYFKVSSDKNFSVKITEEPGAGDFYAELSALKVTSDDVNAFVNGPAGTFTDFNAAASSIVLDDDEFRTEVVTTLN